MILCVSGVQRMAAGECCQSKSVRVHRNKSDILQVNTLNTLKTVDCLKTRKISENILKNSGKFDF